MYAFEGIPDVNLTNVARADLDLLERVIQIDKSASAVWNRLVGAQSASKRKKG